MNVDDAILAHARWKIRLTNYLKNPDGSIDIAQLQAEDKCDLGRWIAGEGVKHGTLPEYAELRAAHAKFHRIAADVVRKADRKQIANADAELGLGSNFGSASTAVVNCIKALGRKLAPAHA